MRISQDEQLAQGLKDIVRVQSTPFLTLVGRARTGKLIARRGGDFKLQNGLNGLYVRLS